MCMCNFASKDRPRNDLYCVGWDVKPYSLTHSLRFYFTFIRPVIEYASPVWHSSLTVSQSDILESL